MKFFKYAKILLPLFIAVFVLPMVIPGPGGKPVMSVDDWLPDQQTLDDAAEALGGAVNSAAEAAGQEPIIRKPRGQQLYKWQDEHGRWQFSDDPRQVPEHILAVEQQAIPQVINKYDAPAQPEPQQNTAVREMPKIEFDTDKLPIQQIPQIIEGATTARDMMEQRNQNLESY